MRLRPFILCFYRTAFTVQKSGLKSSAFRPKSFPRISPKSYRHNAVSNCSSLRFSTSHTNGPRSLSLPKAGTHSPFGERSHTAAYTAKRGAFRMGMVSLPSERFARFGNPARPGIRTAYFAAFGAWSWVLPKNAESLRDSDAHERIAVPKASRPRWAAQIYARKYINFPSRILLPKSTDRQEKPLSDVPHPCF